MGQGLHAQQHSFCPARDLPCLLPWGTDPARTVLHDTHLLPWCLQGEVDPGLVMSFPAKQAPEGLKPGMQVGCKKGQGTWVLVHGPAMECLEGCAGMRGPGSVLKAHVTCSDSCPASNVPLQVQLSNGMVATCTKLDDKEVGRQLAVGGGWVINGGWTWFFLGCRYAWPLATLPMSCKRRSPWT